MCWQAQLQEKIENDRIEKAKDLIKADFLTNSRIELNSKYFWSGILNNWIVYIDKVFCSVNYINYKTDEQIKWQRLLEEPLDPKRSQGQDTHFYWIVSLQVRHFRPVSRVWGLIVQSGRV